MPLAPRDEALCRALADALVLQSEAPFAACPCPALAGGLATDLGIPDERAMIPRFLSALRATGTPWPAVGVTSLQLRDCRGSVVSGLAELDGRVGFVSYHETPDLAAGASEDEQGFLRLIRSALHETGHLAGLGHCGAFACVMQAGHGVRMLPDSRFPFCPRCAVRWRRFAVAAEGGTGGEGQ